MFNHLNVNRNMKCHNPNCNKSTGNKKFCSHRCANTINMLGKTHRGKSSLHKCPVCKTKFRGRNVCCSTDCSTNRRKNSSELHYKKIIDLWKTSKISGLNSNGVVIRAVKKYLRIKFNNSCCLCGWNKINPFTNLVPLTADHIDGNWKNNSESNLRLICPNCDALSETYGGANRGNGRGYLKVVKLK